MSKEEYKTDENHKPSEFILKAVEMLEPSYTNENEMFTDLGKIIRKVQDYATDKINNQ